MEGGDGEKIRIRPWDAKLIKPGSTCFIIGRRGAGKSCLMRDLMWNLHQTGTFEIAIGMSPTEEASPSLAKFMPSSLIYSEYRADVIRQVLNTQKEACVAGNAYNVVLVLDDCMYDKAIMKSKVMREVLMNGRHMKLTVIVLVQYMMDLPPQCRSQIDIVISTRDPIIDNRKKLHKHFFGFFETYKDFSKCYKQCTNDYSVFVSVNNGKPTNAIDDCCFWYKAKTDIPDFRFGAPWTWKLNDRYSVPPHSRPKPVQANGIKVVRRVDTDNKSIISL